MTSATDELRRLLDERGVEYYGGYDITEWDVDGTHYLATEPLRLDGRIVLRRTCTPAQAIDATLGRGACKDVGRYAFVCSECGWASDEPHHVLGGFWPKYCPECGRAVVE